MCFGCILSYTNICGASTHPSFNHDNEKFRSHSLKSWPKISKMFLDNLLKLHNIKNVDWPTHPDIDWEYLIQVFEKTKELLWPHVKPFTKNVNQCFIYCNSFGLEGAWQLCTCQHMYHLQCLVMLMVGRWRCLYCRTLFHKCIYEQFNLQIAMPTHWEYN
jgi:hypothetical protein